MQTYFNAPTAQEALQDKVGGGLFPFSLQPQYVMLERPCSLFL
jgi:hypothetical protein